MAASTPRWVLPASARFLAVLILLGVPCCALADYVPDELIVKMKPGRTAQSAVLNAVPGAVAVSRNRKHGLMRIKVPKGVELSKAIAEYRQDPSVAYVGPNHILRITTEVMPDDPLFREGIDWFDMGIIFTEPQWGLYNDGVNNNGVGTYRADIHAPEAWAITTGSPNVIIAVIDTGYNHTHPDMVDKLWTNPGEIAGNGLDDDGNGYADDVRGWDFVNNDADPMDDHIEQGMEVHHGTFTASIAAASTNNGVGVAGVAWQCPVLPAKVMDANGYGLESDVADAVYYAADLGARVINMSLAGTDDVPALADAVEYAWDQGAILVCASGNENVSTPMYPASYPRALSVGATNEYDERCTAADWMQGGSNYGDYLDVMAPGNEILGATNLMDQNGYYNLPGTSAAAPFVSGIAALIWSLHPDWTNSQVFYQILLTADDIGATGWDIETGWGRANAYRALAESIKVYNKANVLKTLATSTRAILFGAVLSTSSDEIPGRLYVQDPDGTSGICLDYSAGTVPSGLLEGDVVDVFGQMGHVLGERAFINPTITRVGHVSAPRPVAMVSSAMGGGGYGLQGAVVDKRYPSPALMAVGVNNIGKLVTITGRVTAVWYDWFFIDDGCNLDDGSGYPGVYVYNGGLDRPPLNAYAVVTGISSCEYNPGSTSIRHRVLRPRRQSDIQTLQ